MNTKSLFSGIIGIIIFSLIFGYSLVFAGDSFFDVSPKITYKVSENLYLDSLDLKSTMILIESGKDLSSYNIESDCNIFSKLKLKNKNKYLFELKVFDNKCNNKFFKLVDKKGKIELNFKLNLIKEYKILSSLLDFKTSELNNILNIFEKRINEFKKYEKYDKNIEKNYYIFIQRNRKLKETIYNKKIVENIVEKRKQKYLVPIKGKKISTKLNRLPNTGRPYRASYTDGIHHGWDIVANLGETVIAIDDGIIIRKVSDFHYADLYNIKKTSNLTYEDKLNNLDILRGNQIWIKTSKGDVIFYSHLDKIFDNVEVGEIVFKGEPIGTVGISGVPDKNYKDYHLHFPIHKNSYIKSKIGKYTFMDYMKWDWYFKGKSSKYILENQASIFK